MVGKGIAVLCLAGGVVLCAASLDLLPEDYLVFEAPRSLVCGAGAVLGLFGFMMLARDHRASDAIASILLLVIAAGTGWITFYAPPGTLQRVLPIVPEDVDEALRHLLFGLGAVACVGSAGWALRRLFR